MGEREAWYAALAAEPENWLLRGVFADWLDERGEAELAEGYRAIAHYRVRVKWDDRAEENRQTGVFHHHISVGKSYHVSHAWYEKAAFQWCDIAGARNQAGWRSRGECEDNAALAYARLTPEEKRRVAAELGPKAG